MATKLYLLATQTISHPSSLDSGDLSTALPSGTNNSSTVSPALTSAFDLGVTPGGFPTQVTSTTGTSAVQTSAHVGTWVSGKLATQTIASATWTFAYAGSENNAAANYGVALSIYVVKPDGTLRGYIYDSTANLGTEFTTSETGRVVNVSGTSLAVSLGDQLVIEWWGEGAQTGTTNRTIAYNFNGGTDPVNGTATSDAASYLSNPNTITFDVPPNAPTLTSPSDTASVGDTTPDLVFNATDTESDAIEYEIQIDTVNTFDSQVGAPVASILYDVPPDSGLQISSNTTDDVQGGGSTFVGTADTIVGAQFYISGVGGATVGNAVAKIYATTGTNGTNAHPTGAALATSDNVAVNTITWSDFELVTFNFSTPFTMTPGTVYAVALQYTGSTTGITLGGSTNASYAGGNEIDLINTTWSGDNSQDFPFKILTPSSAPLIDASSLTDAGFSAGHPFSSGASVTYTVQTALSVTTTYYWRVRGKDPSGSNAWGSWSSIQSFTIVTGSASVSPSSSASPSVSPSASRSPSSSASPSRSPSSSASPSVSPSSSTSPSPSVGYTDYSRQQRAILPTDNADLSTIYSGTDITNVSTSDDVRVGVSGSSGFVLHQFKNFIVPNQATFTCELQTNFTPSISTVFLQIFNQNTGLWETMDSNSSASANTDFVLQHQILDLTNYKDADGVVSCRVYQSAD